MPLPRTTGLVLGKFMPLHKGHELLLTFAAHFVETLYIVVDNIEDAPIAGSLRCQWIQQTFPEAHVFYLPQPTPQSPDEHPDFWNVWKDNLLSVVPKKPDYLFASEQYGHPLAQVIGATFIPFDLARQMVPISATQIRTNPLQFWDYLSTPAQQFYLKRICIFGPESTGKTTLAQALAQHYNTAWVPEYARLFIEAQQEITVTDMVAIAQGQLALEHATLPRANKILFCDTDPLSTLLWSDYLFAQSPDMLLSLIQQNTYDLYLLMSPDLPWEQDPVRYLPDKSQEFFLRCMELLNQYQRPFVTVCGHQNARLECAIKHIDEFLSCLE